MNSRNGYKTGNKIIGESIILLNDLSTSQLCIRIMADKVCKTKKHGHEERGLKHGPIRKQEACFLFANQDLLII